MLPKTDKMSKKERLTDEELLAQFEGIGDGDAPKSGTLPAAGAPQRSQADLLEELGIPERPKSSGRHTPRLSSTSTTPVSKSSPKRSGAGTPPSRDGTRSSDDLKQMRKSGDSTRSFHNSFTPASNEGIQSDLEKKTPIVPEAVQVQSSGGGWWGALTATASAAVKQAEALAKEIQQNEEAQRWAEQVKGNVGTLRGLGTQSLQTLCFAGFLLTRCLGGDLRSRALPTFSNILHTLAPPISSHERLQIHITHDIVGYPSLDPLIYCTFSRVMAQVEGGDLMVIQRGQESSQKRGQDAGYTGSSNSGWSDGPWWRHTAQARNLGAVKGLVEGTKLSKVSAESYATDYYSSRGGLEEAAKQATEGLSETNPTRSSDIFLCLQAISQAQSKALFGGSISDKTSEDGAVEPEIEADDMISFAIYLHDPVHGITFHTITQTLPQKWVQWLDASVSPGSSGESLPEEIAEIIDSGGVDPREWVAEWVEEVLTLGVGVVAQRYVARRMGVGQGGIGRGKARQEALESGGGEAARVI